MTEIDDTITCTHCGAPMLASHSGPCLSCGKQSENVQVIVEETIIEEDIDAGPQNNYFRKRKIAMVTIVLLLMAAVFAVGYFWRYLFPAG